MTVVHRHLRRHLLSLLFVSGFAGLAAQPARADEDPVLEVQAAVQAESSDAALRSRVVDDALSNVGTRYRYGGSTPQTGFDCSGLVRWVFDRSIGMTLPRRAVEIAQMGAKVDLQSLKPGDLVFFNTLRRSFSHVGIYLGDGQFVHAPSKGGAVRVETIADSYWQKRFTGARRIDTQSESPRLN
ncbi:hypothetical protein BH09PSE6_BH09PSE6_17110 [soil metagenome]